MVRMKHIRGLNYPTQNFDLMNSRLSAIHGILIKGLSIIALITTFSYSTLTTCCWIAFAQAGLPVSGNLQKDSTKSQWCVRWQNENLSGYSWTDCVRISVHFEL